MPEILKIAVVGNELWRIGLFFLIVLVALGIGALARLSMEKTGTRLTEGRRRWLGLVLSVLARPVVFGAFAVGFHMAIASGALTLGESLSSILLTVSRVLDALAIGFAVYKLVDIVDAYLGGLAERTESKVDDVLAPLVGKSVRVTVFVLVLLNVAHVVSGKEMSAIIAGLGVGGLAFALAAQDSLKNFFGSLVILSDKPFEIGDRVVVDGHDGPVESVGFRSTRIRTLSGHLVTVPNSELVNKTVENIGRRPYIKKVMNVTITYDTAPEKVKEALTIVRGLLLNHEGMHPDFPPRIYFSDFNDWSLNLLVIFWFHPPDYWLYMEFCEKLNMQILEKFNAAGIDFAFPSQTVYVANDEKRQMALRMLAESSPVEGC